MSEWDQRQLCPDGSCVGVIGSDGTCKVCGRAAPNWGDERKRGLIDPDAESSDASRPPAFVIEAKNDALYFDVDPNEEDEDDEGDEYEDDEEGDDDEAEGAAASPEWEQRKLCPDDACIGVIGDNGMCKVCGRGAEDNEDEDEDESEHEDDDEDENEDADEAGDGDAAAAHASTAAPEWDDRKLCSDEACTGLIGANGRCKVCNRSAA